MGEDTSRIQVTRIMRAKHDKSNAFFVASRAMFQDERLSWAARGVLGYLLSKPDNWETRTADLVRQSPGGRRLVAHVLRELKAYGYMERIRVRDDKTGRFTYITVVYESPQPELIMQVDRDTAIRSTASGSAGNGSAESGTTYIVENVQNTDHTNAADAAGAPASEKTPPKRDPTYKPRFAALASVTHSDSRAAQAYIGKTTRDLSAYKPEDIERWYGPGGWWYTVHCSGMTNPPVPTLGGIAKTINLAAEWERRGSPVVIPLPANRKAAPASEFKPQWG